MLLNSLILSTGLALALADSSSPYLGSQSSSSSSSASNPFLLPGGLGSSAISLGAVASTCDIGYKPCDGKCIPTLGTCCNTGSGGYCEATKVCVSGGCCPIGKTCSGAPSGPLQRLLYPLRHGVLL
ncbi:hypothetical protein COL940_009157 [Colletotrichum noveboracense]|nr:hypothetical protein COL940_009157 [Colletotrichum noveboracense]